MMNGKNIEMTEIQKGIYFDCQLAKTTAYNISAALKLKNVEESYLENAMKLLIKEQEMLRSGFALEDGIPTMFIHGNADFELPVLDISRMSEAEKTAAAAACKERIYGSVFALEAAPLFRAELVKEDEQKHKLFICCHHLICDGISMNILKDKLMSNYLLLSRGGCIEVKEDEGYGVYADEENKKIKQGEYKAEQKYWKEKLSGAEAIGLSPDFSMIPDHKQTGREKRFFINDTLYKKLELQAMDMEVTLFSCFLAAFKVLMHKHTRSEEVIVASPFSNRPALELEETIGCFVNMLPLRSVIQKDMTFERVAQNVGNEMIAALKHMSYPNNLIMRENGLASNLGEPSVLDISFVYDVYDGFAKEGVSAEILKDDEVTFSGNIMAVLNKTSGQTELKLQYTPSMYSDESIELIGRRYLKLLETVSNQPDIQIDDLNLFVEAEQSQILDDFNDTSYFAHEYTTPVQLFNEKVKKHPTRTAIITPSDKYSYEVIDKRSNQLARKILEYKTKENEVIGIQLERSTELIISILAVLKAGCAYVPIDYAYPESRKEFIFEDAEISIMITSEGMPFNKNWDISVVFADDASIYTGNDEQIDMEYNPHGLAYIEYTSGSTGAPKGVMIECHSLVNTLKDLERRFPVEEQDVYMFKTAFSFDVSGTEIYGWFMGEGSLFILDIDGEKDPDQIIESIEKYHVTHINFVPSMFRLFLDSLREDQAERIKGLKYIFVGGEAITYDLIEKFEALNSQVRLENVYGPTECTIWASHQPLEDCEEKVNISIGRPLNATRWYVIDDADRLLPVGIPGELVLSGAGLARGYLNRDELNAERFVKNPFYREGEPEYYQHMYKTGDLAKWLPDGTIEFMGRLDFQVKIRGVRLELGEIENAMLSFPGMIQVVVVTKVMPNKATILCAYYMSEQEVSSEKLREDLHEKLPAYMIPSFFVHIDKMPLNTSGKVNRNVLSARMDYLNDRESEYIPPNSDTEKKIVDIWKQVLGFEAIGLDENFFDKGGHSVALMDVHNRLKKQFTADFSITKLFQLSTIRLQADFIDTTILGKETVKKKVPAHKTKRVAGEIDRDIAIVGMAVNVPGSDNIGEFWNNLKYGNETIHHYSESELKDLHIREDIIAAPNYVRAKGRIDGIEEFDPDFFGYSPADIKMMSPQLRLLYKGAWEAFEDAGYYPGQNDSRVGVYLGGSDDFRWYQKALMNDGNYSDRYQAFTMGTNHFLATRLAYKFNLKGPVYTALTGCSTSLVTVHLAAQSLMLGECDMALAGGITVEMPNEGGYLYEDGMMFSPDGHCRPFDNAAKGTVFSNGMGLVVLKRLKDAVKDNDRIYAVIKGSAVNNDGNRKVGYAAPSVEGQIDVIHSAMEAAGVEPEEITYVEAHGTGTLLGDPIEVESLSAAFETKRRGFCTLGSVKGNIGHTDTAAGVIGLEKAALSLYHKYLPGTIRYETPNEKINFEMTPFTVAADGKEWLSETPRYAGINSFGIGGTNAHMILGEAPLCRQSSEEREISVLTFSGTDEDAVNRNAEKILAYLHENPQVNLSDAAWTLKMARQGFSYRKAIAVSGDIRDDREFYLEAMQTKPEFKITADPQEVYFMFSGQGSQYQGMGRELYYGSEKSEISVIYKRQIDKVLNCLEQQERSELLEILFGSEDDGRINQTRYTQMVLFLTEYALAKTMLEIGIKPKGLIGHSIGEVTAAAVAGVWSLEDAVTIVKARGELMQRQNPGVMLAVMEAESAVKDLLPADTFIALKNTTGKCVAAGTEAGIVQLEKILGQENMKSMKVKTSHAFHTPMMRPAAEAFGEVLEKVEMNQPTFPILSNVSGTWAKDDEIVTPKYWADHITTPVHFEENLSHILGDGEAVYIETGAGKTLTAFAKQHASKKAGHRFINLMRHPKEKKEDVTYLNDRLGDLWSLDVRIDWEKLRGDECRNIISLPAYQFEKASFPIDIPADYSTGSRSQPIEQIEVKPKMESADVTVIEQPQDLRKQIEAAFYNVFGFKKINENRDFFDMGGDSLKAVSLCAELRDLTGIKTAVKDIFDHPTLRELTEYLESIPKKQEVTAVIKPAEKSEVYPLSAAQARMFSLYQLDQSSLAYNLPSATKICGRLDKDKFEQAIRKLAARHESLRTHFEIRSNKAVQIVNESVEVEIEYQQGQIGEETFIDQHIDSFVRPFNLAKAPLFRVRLIEGNEEEYLLLFDLHHIIADGTSVEIISRDFNALYAGELDTPDIQYKDYAVWENQLNYEETCREEKAYWLDYLGGELPLLELPTDFERPRIMDHTGGRIHFELGKSLSRKAGKLAGEAGATLYMTLLGVWNILLGRYSGQEDIIVGSPTAGRYHPEIKETVGMFVNMLAMRNYPAADKTFKAFLQEVKEHALSSFKYQDYQFDSLAQNLNMNRELNRNMLFDVCFDYQNMEFYELEADGLKYVPYDFDTNCASYDLVLTCQENKEKEICCFMDYSKSLYKEETILRMIEHFKNILEQVTAEDSITLGEISLITSREMDFMERSVNNTGLEVPNDLLIHEIFEEKVRKDPDKIAVTAASGTELTYQELNDRANVLADRLRELNVAKDELVGFMPARDEQLFVAQIGILKAGAAYVPIDPDFPAERVAYMLEKSNSRVLICPSKLQKKIEFNGEMIDCAVLFDKNGRENTADEKLKDRSSRLACTIFTSGSTGKPKGVQINHSSIVNFVYEIINRKILSRKEDKVICVTTVSFDIFGFESLTPLCTGHSIYIADRMEQLDPALAAKRIVEHQVTHILSTVSRIKAFVDNREFEPALKQLDYVLSGGENFPVSLLKDLQRRSDAKIFNMYGPTETTIWSTTKELTREEQISIGKPVANTRVYIMNEQQRLQPVGVYGELCISGKGLARGYLDNQEETNAKFVQVPEIGELVYRTGDKARLLANGEVEIIGRLDSQIKIRGYRIELDEIEKVALQNEMINQAVVTVREDANQNKQLMMFYSSKEVGAEPEAQRGSLKKWLEQQLPHYMVPSNIVRLNTLPVLPNGKLDRKALTAGNYEVHVKPPAVRPDNLTEQLLTIWREVLDNDNVGVKDNFFDKGGNSLSLILVNNKLNDILTQPVPLLQLFENPTIEALVNTLDIREETVEEDMVEKNTDDIDIALPDFDEALFSGNRDVAVIGMSCRFPGAENLEEYWENIVSGKETIADLTDGELREAGVPEEQIEHAGYVKRKGVLEGAEHFDSDFFGYSGKEANLMDPQMRVLHECAFDALDNGGCNPETYQGKIGLFAGSGSNVLWMAQMISPDGDLVDTFEAMTLNEKDFLTTKISYKLDLTGPSVNVQSACSTSLVAVHQAVESIQNGESDMALAGGVCISYPRKEGYMWHQGMIFSKDGCCRPFSEDASGTVSGNGCGVVLLKPLDEAVEDRDHIYAVIKGSAVNNDGMDKVGYTAPGIKGQSSVIKEALTKAAVNPEQITYLEAHGTGTELGDPIEVEALKKAWNTNRKQFCSIGSVKANIGHLDAAAGIAGFIKTALIMDRRVIPPLTNYHQPNPRLNLEESPFYVSRAAEPHLDNVNPLYAGVSSFGIGGTNAHVILGSYAADNHDGNKHKKYTLLFSGNNPAALNQSAERILKAAQKQQYAMSDLAFTLQSRKHDYKYRKAIVVETEYLNSESEEVLGFIEREPQVIKDRHTPVLIYSSPAGNGIVLREMYQNKDEKICAAFRAQMEKLSSNLLPEEKEYLTGLEMADNCEINEQYEVIIGLLISESYHKVLGLLEISEAAVMGSHFGELNALVSANVIQLRDAAEFIRSHFDKIKSAPLGAVIYAALGLGLKYDKIRSLHDSLKNYQLRRPNCSLYVDNPQDRARIPEDAVYISMRHDSLKSFHSEITRLWEQGMNVDISYLCADQTAHKVSVPGYVFEKKSYTGDVSLNKLFNRAQETGKTLKETGSHSHQTIRQTLEGLWIEALGCGKPNDQDTLFDLEGHSLTAISLSNKMKEIYGVEMPVSEILDHPEFGYMVNFISEQKSNIYPASAAQKRMYTVHEMSETGTPYNLAAAYIIKGRLNQERFQEAFDKLLSRHESLRTRFIMRSDEIYQVIEENITTPLVFADAGQKDVSEIVNHFVQRFDLAKAPLMRAGVFKCGEEQFVFVLDIHHIIADQTSLAILMDEFQALYGGKLLKPLEMQYKEFAGWQNQRLADGSIEKQKEYWQKEFAEPVPAIEITDHQRSTDASRRARKYQLEFDQDLCDQINAFAKQRRITPFMLSFAALKILLWKVTQETDLCVGTGTAGRNSSKVENVVGMFVNTLAVRTKIDGKKTVEQYLDYFKKKLISAYENQEYQFETMIRDLEIETEINRTPLFDVMFNYVNMGTDELILDGLELTPWEDDEIDAKFDITLTLEENKGSYLAELQYAEALFEESTIKFLIHKWSEIIGTMISRPGVELHELSIVSQEEETWILNELNDTVTNAPLTQSVIDLFQEQVKERPEQTALRWNGESVSYAKLDQISDQIAKMLQNKDVGSDARVALLLERGVNQIAAILGVLKCGAVYVPADPEYPQERIDHILRDSEAKLLISSPECLSAYKTEMEILELTQELMAAEREAEAFKLVPRSGTDLMYIMYTSGSTGLPKGTLITHGNAIRVVRNTNYVEITEQDRILQLSNYAFDGSVFDIYGALLNGAALVLADKPDILDMERLTGLIKAEKVTITFVTAALFNMIVDCDVSAFKGMKKVLTGGEAMSLHHAAKASEVLGENRLVNVYGPTETCVYASYYPIGKVSAGMKNVPIGKPIANTTLYVLDENQKLLPPYMPGELYIGGKGVAQGYLNRPDLNSEKFIQLTFGTGEKVYRTGDRVRMLGDGNIEFLGRTDFQVKIRGFRIEPGEVEKLIQNVEAVRETIVIPRKDSGGSLYLAAYYTAEPGVGITSEMIKNSLSAKVPEYMIPAKMLRMEELPLTPNGKIDRKALPEIKDQQRLLAEEEKPQNPIQEIIIEKMQKVLDRKCLSIHDDFFGEGGQSIKAIALCRALSGEGIPLRVNEVFQNPTAYQMSQLPEIRKLTDNANAQQAAAPVQEMKRKYFVSDEEIENLSQLFYENCNALTEKIIRKSIRNNFRFSPVQQAHQHLGANNSGFTLKLQTEIMQPDMCKLAARIIADNQLLHCSIDPQSGCGWQEYDIKAEELVSLIHITDIRSYEESAQKKIIDHMHTRIFSEGYTKDKLPWRLCIMQQAENAFYLIWGFDHLVFDGMSSEILKQKIEKLADEYAGQSADGQPDGQDINGMQYSNYVKLLEEGPQAISSRDIQTRFALDTWDKTNRRTLAKLKQYGDSETKSMELSIPFTSGSHENIWWEAFKTVRTVISRYTESSEAALGLLDYGRKYGSSNFFDCVGEFLDIIPVMASEDKKETDIADLLNLCGDKHINFLSLSGEHGEQSKFVELEKQVSAMYGTGKQNLDIILFNFQGYVSKEERSAFKGLEEEAAISQFLVNVNYDDEKLYIEFDSVFGIDERKLRNIVSELAAEGTVWRIAS